MSYVASIFMETFARSWPQGGTSGYYMMSSANESTGYVYFIGAQTTAGPLGKTLLVNHSFTSIEVVANKNELVSLYKAAAKTTTDIPNPGNRYIDWLYNSKYLAYVFKSGTTNTSSPWILPGSAMPLVDIGVIAGGGGSQAHSSGAGGGGIVYLTYFPVSSSGLSWTIGSGGAQGSAGGNTTLGSITAVGGAAGPGTPSNGNNGGNGSGASTHGNQGSRTGGSSTQGQPSVTSPTTGVGYGHNAGNVGNSNQHIGTGGGGAGGPSNNGGQTPGGPGFLLPIDFQYYGAGGGGANHDAKLDGQPGVGAGNWGQGANSLHGGGQAGIQGGIVLRYYT